MVDDVLHEDKPDSALTERIIQAMDMASSQSFSGRLQSANEMLELIETEGTRDPAALKNAVLGAIEHLAGADPKGAQRAIEHAKAMPPEQVRDSIKTDLLLMQMEHTTGEGRRAAADEVMKHIEGIGESAIWPGTLLSLADMLDSVSRFDEATAYHLKAIQTAKSASDTAMEGEAHMRMAGRHMRNHEPSQARDHFVQARDLLPIGDPALYKESCAAALALLDEVGDETAARLIRYLAACGILEEEDGAISFLEQPWIGVGGRLEDAPGLNLCCVLMQVSFLDKMLPRSPDPGVEWSGGFNSWFFAPLQTTAVVKRTDDSATVPAGTFDNCLLIEYVTQETTAPDDAPEDVAREEKGRRAFCGTRLAWFAPGVGLVQLRAHTSNGMEVVIQLKDYSASNGGHKYFPLAVGNTWTYCWADIPDHYVASETYRITANDRNKWYLSHHQYVYKR